MRLAARGHRAPRFSQHPRLRRDNEAVRRHPVEMAPEPWLQEEEEWHREPVAFTAPVLDGGGPGIGGNFVAGGGGNGSSYAAGGVYSTGTTFTQAAPSPSPSATSDDGEGVRTRIARRPDGTNWYEVRGRGAVGAADSLRDAQRRWLNRRDEILAQEHQAETVRRIYAEGSLNDVARGADRVAESMNRLVERSTDATETFNRQLAYLQNLLVDNGFTEEERRRVDPALREALRRSSGSASASVTVTGRTSAAPRV